MRRVAQPPFIAGPLACMAPSIKFDNSNNLPGKFNHWHTDIMLFRKPKNRNKQMRIWILVLSITFNILFLLGWGLKKLNSSTNKLGILTKDIEVG